MLGAQRGRGQCEAGGRRPPRNQSAGASISDSSCRDRRRRAWPVSLPRRALGGRGDPCSGRSLRRAPGAGPRTPQTQARWPGHHSDQQVLLKAGCGDGLGRERHRRRPGGDPPGVRGRASSWCVPGPAADPPPAQVQVGARRVLYPSQHPARRRSASLLSLSCLQRAGFQHRRTERC